MFDVWVSRAYPVLGPATPGATLCADAVFLLENGLLSHRASAQAEQRQGAVALLCHRINGFFYLTQKGTDARTTCFVDLKNVPSFMTGRAFLPEVYLHEDQPSSLGMFKICEYATQTK